MNYRTTKAACKRGTLPAAALCVLLAAFARPASAAYEDLGAGARGPGMGNAMAAVSDDIYSVHYNPAGLGLVTRAQFGAAYTQHLVGLTDGSNLGTSFFGYARPLAGGDRGTVAGAFNSFSLDGGLYRENTLYLSYGRLAWERPGKELFLGATAKYLSSSFGSFDESLNSTDGIIRNAGVADPLLAKRSQSAFDLDAGLIYKFSGHYQFGLQAAHITQPDISFGGTGDKLPAALKAGFNYKSLISNLVMQAETRHTAGGTDNIFTAAAERWFPRTFVGDFGLRGAISTGSRQYRQASLGLSYRNRRMQVDYGFSMPFGTISGTSGSHRMGLTFFFGKASEEEETLAMLMDRMAALKQLPAAAAAPVVSTVTVYVGKTLTPQEKEIAAKLAAAEEAIKAARYREAISLSSLVVQLAPANTAAWQNLGIAWLGMSKYESSLYAWNKAYEYETSPALRVAIKGYIRSISRMAYAAPAEAPAPAPVRKARATLPPSVVESMLDQAVNYYVAKDFVKAREMFDKVLAADPDNIEALKAVRRLSQEKGR